MLSKNIIPLFVFLVGILGSLVVTAQPICDANVVVIDQFEDQPFCIPGTGGNQPPQITTSPALTAIENVAY